MAAPTQDFVEAFLDEEQKKTYSEWLDTLSCTCPAGAQIRPSSLPSATIDLGDVIADHARIISVFTSAYGAIAVVLKMIACIMDVLCCLMSPFCVIFALIRLFGTCLPDFILLFPQFAVPAIIICVIKIILALIEYITTVFGPLIQDIIRNFQDLLEVISDQNDDAIDAITFKIAALFKELFNVLGTFAVLNAVWIMIEALLSAGISLPCGGSGGSCSECGSDEDICPTTLQQTGFNGSDGQFVIIFGSDGFSYQILFYSASRSSNFLQMRGFFPKGLDYSIIDDEDDVPYVLNITQPDGSNQKYVITSVDSAGYSSLFQLPPSYLSDGYLTNTTPDGLPLTDPLEARFNTKTETFTTTVNNRYITMTDTRGASQSLVNGGTWKIQSKYDAFNVLLKRDSDTWNYGAPNEHLRWKLESSAPTVTSGLDFEVEINHEELIRHGLIGVGCHPAIRATREGLLNRFPDTNTLTLPNLPDFNSFLSNINDCMTSVSPLNVDSQYIRNNYQTMANEIVNLETCVTNNLNNFKTEVENYAKQIYPIIFDPETSADGFDPAGGFDPADGYYFDVNPKTQIVGLESNIKLIPIDRNGGRLGVTLPPGIIEVDFDTTLGTLSPVVTELDDADDPTGKYTSTITSLVPGIATITAQVGGRDVSYFNGSDLIQKEIQVEFVTVEEARRRATGISGEVSTEPLGRGRVE